jgi:hypothetical protein
MSPLSKGMEALRKIPRAFCGRAPKKPPLDLPLFASQGGERIASVLSLERLTCPALGRREPNS